MRPPTAVIAAVLMTGATVLSTSAAALDATSTTTASTTSTSTTPTTAASTTSVAPVTTTPTTVASTTAPSTAPATTSSTSSTSSPSSTATTTTPSTSLTHRAPRRVRAGAVTLRDGHADVGFRRRDGGLTIEIKDGTSVGAPAWRPTTDVVIALGSSARREVPAAAAFDFLGDAGDRIWLIPQVQDPDIPWLGWNTEEIPSGAVANDRITWRLLDVDGPGAFALFTVGQFGEPSIIFDSDGPQRSTNVAVGTHAHGNWAFSTPGVYDLRFDASAPGTSSAQATVRVTVEAAAPPSTTTSTGSGSASTTSSSTIAATQTTGGAASTAGSTTASTAPDVLAATGTATAPLLALAGATCVLAGIALVAGARRRGV